MILVLLLRTTVCWCVDVVDVAAALNVEIADR